MQYALRMAAIEKKSLKETLRYTEWEMFCGTGEGEQWKEEIGTPEKREGAWLVCLKGGDDN